ncbi:GIY-YIG nuclease family protein [Candidatus Gottesmanbacteria bacterium]|nr:GIY-YIG nuclease family protein [Candidatus Gottesmanbacteria bacterium]
MERDLASLDKTYVFTYVLIRLLNGDIYIRASDELRNRISLYNNGSVKSTKANQPWVLVYYEAYKDKRDAYRRETQL